MASRENLQPSHEANRDLECDRPSNPRPTRDPKVVVKLIGKKLHLDGFLFSKSTTYRNRITWECRKYRAKFGEKRCPAKVITSDPANSEEIIVYEVLSAHNHEPNLQEVEEAEAIMENRRKKRELQMEIPRNYSAIHPDPIRESYTESDKLQGSGSTQTNVKKEEDELMISETEVMCPVRSNAKGATCLNGSDYDFGSSSARLIGTRLYIDGFIYIKNKPNTDSSKIYWQCRWYNSRECGARAITSNPDLCQELIIYKGPDESGHSHSASFADVKEAEEAANLNSTVENSKLNDTKGIIEQAVDKMETPVTPESSNSFTAKPPRSKESAGSIAELLNRNMSVKLIGQRLYIDGYIYIKQFSGSDVHWACSRNSGTTGCTAKVSTSNPFGGGKLIVYSIDNLSTHDHSPSELEVEEAELIARLEVNRSKLGNSIGVPSSHGIDQSHVQNLVHCRNYSSVQMNPAAAIASAKSNWSPQERTTESSPVLPQKVTRTAESFRLIGKRLYIDGYIYINAGRYGRRVKWECKRYRKTGCPGRASTSDPYSNKDIILYKGPDESKHNHPPSPAELEDSEILAKISSTDEKSKSKLPVRSSSRVNAKMCHSFSEDYQSSSFDEVANFASADTRSHSQSQHLKGSRASDQTRVSRRSRKPERMGFLTRLLTKHSMYRKFLMKFLDKPIFDRHSVIEALKVIYSSKHGCLTAYGTVLENRKKIERDIETLKINPNAPITALRCDSFTTVQNDEAEGDFHEEKYAQNNVSAILPIDTFVTVQKNNTAETKTQCESTEQNVLNTRRMEVPEESPESQSHPTPQQVKNADLTVPAPAASTVNNLPISKAPVLTMKSDEPKMKREIVCIDLIDNSEGKLRVKPEFGIQIGAMPQITTSDNNEENNAPAEQNNNPGIMQNMENFYPNFLLNSFGPPQHNYYQNPFLVHPSFSSNAYYNPAVYYPVGYSFNNSNFIAPGVKNDVQIPVIINVPSNERNYIIMDREQFHAQQQILRQPNTKK
ncbi:hypothetical protein QAD02_006758 [Eretmocerus hayati]|uniref:Uncharacterized protein n=1 Tax=Eretmocerus hayati TaxID=131215 RepID=A0ACC2N2Z3_9HYME|nr:hypothetical protein QAD02_006758 [Eretmocerus hayati]